MPFNLQEDDNKNNDNEKEIDIKPSGMMKVSPNPGGGRKKEHKNKFRLTSVLTKPAATVSLIAVVVISVVFSINAASDKNNASPQDNDDNISDITDKAPDSLLNKKICGSWSFLDYVENIDDFNPNKPNYKNYELKFKFYNYEFFEDNTVAARNNGEEKIFSWAKDGEILSLMPDIITVYEIKERNTSGYMFIKIEMSDSVMGNETPGYYVLKKNKEKYLFSDSDVKNKDLRNYNLSDAGGYIYNISFDENTKFPTNRERFPQSDECQPGYILERGKNPGLGVESLHSQGITGKGVNIAVIDEALLDGHPEYIGKIAGYKDFSGGETSSMQGPAVVSLLAGEDTGVAPGVNIYYAAVPSWKMYDAEYYAKALDWIIEVNESLPDGEKIRAVCITPNPENPEPWINVEKYLESFKKATEAGMLVLDCTDEHGVSVGGCKYDFNSPEDVSLCKPMSPYRIFIAPNHYDGKDVKDIYVEEENENNENMLRAPINYRTTAAAYIDSESGKPEYFYQYEGNGRLSWAIPYVTGVLAMGWQVKPELTPDEMIRILFNTAFTDERKNKYINPAEFIKYIQESLE